MCKQHPPFQEPVSTLKKRAKSQEKHGFRSRGKFNNGHDRKAFWDKFWPIPLPVVIALAPLVPQSLYLNRGYTIWFHLLSFAYFLTRDSFLRKFLILQGAGICLGWYAVVVHDWFVEGTFCHTLYRSMPTRMQYYMVVESTDSTDYVILNTYSSWAMKAFSHILDFIGHPGLAYLFWKLHRKAGGTLNDVLRWPVIVSAWHFSRVWSLVHSYHNTGKFSFWYLGFDVYAITNLNSYVAAYIAEAACFLLAILLRVYWDMPSSASEMSPRITNITKDIDAKLVNDYYESTIESDDESQPMLVHSESTMSTSSLEQ